MKLGVPSKGRLKKEVLSWFNHKGVEIITSEDDRSYAAKVTGFSDIQLFFLPPVEIPTLLSKGVLDLGVTGQDLIEEKIPEWDNYVKELKKLGIGHADLVIAVPEFLVDVSNLEDLDEVAKIFRNKMGQHCTFLFKSVNGNTRCVKPIMIWISEFVRDHYYFMYR